MMSGRQIWAAVFSPDSQEILIVGGGGARLWDMKNKRDVRRFRPSGGGWQPCVTRPTASTWRPAAGGYDRANLERGDRTRGMEARRAQQPRECYRLFA